MIFFINLVFIDTFFNVRAPYGYYCVAFSSKNKSKPFEFLLFAAQLNLVSLSVEAQWVAQPNIYNLNNMLASTILWKSINKKNFLIRKPDDYILNWI
jgi:hypothetical protein